jgi:hypothetical protein
MATKKKKEQPLKPDHTITVKFMDNSSKEVIQLPAMSPKQAILLFLKSYIPRTPDPVNRAPLMETWDVLNKGLISMRVSNIDRVRLTYGLNVTIRANADQELIQEHLEKPWVKQAIADAYGLTEFLKELNKKPLRPTHIKVARHGVKQLTGKTGPQIPMTFEEGPVEVEDYIEQAGLQVSPQDKERLLEGWGADLTVIQHSVLLAVLERMSEKNYRGERKEPLKEVLKRAGVNPPGGRLPQLMEKAFRNIKDFPVVRLYLHEIVELAGMDKEAQRDKLEVKQALEHLGTAPYAFYWERLVWTEGKGGKMIPARDQDGRYVMEGVDPMAGAILYVKRIIDPQSGQLDYYEISPSAPFLDQVTEGYGAPGGYFLMMPTGLLDKVRKAVGPGRRVTPHYYTFLYWLLAKYADRCSDAKKFKKAPNLQVREHFENIAQLIRMPESIWRRKRVKAVERLESIYQATKELGYLKSYSMGADGIVTLELDPSGPFYRPKKDQELPPGAEG